jgi:hypothetical protein
MEKKLLPKNRLTLGTENGLYSTIPPLFDLCGDNDLMSLSLAGVNPFLDWLGWQATDIYRLVREFVLFNRAAGTPGEGGNVKTSGWLCDPCADPKGVESSGCELVIEGFSRLRRMGPVRDITKTGLNYCEISPRFRIDGVTITDDREYDLNRAVEVLIQDLASMVIVGNKDTCGQFDGLENLVTSYADCCWLSSILIDWNGNDMDGGAGATWDGNPIPTTATFVDLLMALVRRIRTRIRMVPTLAGRGLVEGDMILVMPSSFISCLLDAYTCWSVCANDFSFMQSFEARRFRDALNGGMFGAGQITIEGVTIPIMPYDFELINSGNTFDAYLLVRGVGNRRWLYGQYNNMTPVAAKIAPSGEFMSLDGGRILTWNVSDHTCEERVAEMQPRLVLEAPWSQVRITDIRCDALGGPLSSDPWADYFPYACEEIQQV